MAPRMSKRRHQGPQMAIPRSQKGPAAEGVALKIRHRAARHQWSVSNALVRLPVLGSGILELF